jgi:hypothetical protein
MVREDPPLYADATHVTRKLGSFLLTLSLAAPNERSLRAFATAIEQHDTPVFVMIVVASAARAPDAATKDAIREVTVRLQERIAAFAYVVEGEGFAAATVRGAISFISMFARYAFPQRVLATVGEAAAWLLQQQPANDAHAYDARQIVRAIDEMRSELRPREPHAVSV